MDVEVELSQLAVATQVAKIGGEEANISRRIGRMKLNLPSQGKHFVHHVLYIDAVANIYVQIGSPVILLTLKVLDTCKYIRMTR